MKLKNILLLLCTLFALAGCEEEIAGGDEASLTIPYTSKTLTCDKGSFVLAVESNTEWRISSSAEWLVPSKSDFVGAASVLLTFGANTSTSARNAKLVVEPKIEGSAPSHSILVTQKGTTSTDSGNNNDNSGDDDDDNDDNSGDDEDDENDNSSGGGGASGTKFAGWAELPAEEENSDYYYAYHIRPDNSSQRNFSVCYSAEMACPVWVAAPIHKCYIGSASRSGYSQDPEIPASIQAVPDAGDTNKGNWMNRGHMLASNMRTISSATNQQVFYYTNIAPQNGNNFNTGSGWWNNLEDIEKGDFMCTDTLYTVNGCHWANKNETFNGQVVPTHFYKVFLRTKKGNSGKWVVNCSESELQCVAFYVPHTIGKTTPSRSHMISVSELEEITGHTFFPNVPNAPKESFSASDWGM